MSGHAHIKLKVIKNSCTYGEDRMAWQVRGESFKSSASYSYVTRA